ncbi:MAG: tRNA1Val (adenine37-N6)-methyltransferase [Bradymonadia bacterium]|jgi:tRNA1Val (adenine37-N6)-methyltransferase
MTKRWETSKEQLRRHSLPSGGLQRAPPDPQLPVQDTSWPSDASLDDFVGDWQLWQRKGGHRTSIDDLLVAWSAVRRWREQETQAPQRYVDLGCGIGSVMLMVAHALRPNETRGVEAQEQSVTMARRTIDGLNAAPNIEVVGGDLRSIGPDEVGKARLVTGSPPYFPVGTATPSPDPQRAACRVELRGGVEAYCEAAARVLNASGTFHVVFQTIWDERVLNGAISAGLHLVERDDVWMREERHEPFLTAYVFSKEPVSEPVCRPEWAVRDRDGAPTATYQAMRRQMACFGA